MIFLSPFFFFLLLERSASLAGVLSALAVAEVDDWPCWISFTCGGGGSAWSPAESVGFSSLGSADALGFNSLGSAAPGEVIAVALRPNGEPPPGVVLSGGAAVSAGG